MDEIIDILEEKTGVNTGKTTSKNKAHKEGLWHGAIHILIVNKEHDKTLLQKRCELKELFPNTWDIAVGGHISAGEDDITAAKRELEEELGVNSSDYEFNFIEKVQGRLENNGIINNEYVSIFVIYADININDLKLQETEVSDVKWCTKEELNEFIEQKNIIIHKRDYEILSEMLN